MCEEVAIVVDNGCGKMKAGFSGEDAARTVLPTVVGYRQMGTQSNLCEKEFYIGDEAIAKCGLLTMEYPMKNGHIINWDDMEKIWHHIFFLELRTNPAEHPLLLTETPLNFKSEREKMAEIMFETFKTPALYIAMQEVLALYACGRTTGIVLNCGNGASHIVPVYDGFALPHAVQSLGIAGRDLTDYLAAMLNNRGGSLHSAKDHLIAQDIKHKLCYVASSFEQELQAQATPTHSYDLPDGQRIMVGSERFRCPEALFQPSLLGMDGPGLHQACHRSILCCDPDMHAHLYSNMLLTGGSTMFPGLQARLREEVSALAGPATDMQVLASPDRPRFPWLGGSILASLAPFPQMCVSRREYDEAGVGVVHRKCF